MSDTTSTCRYAGAKQPRLLRGDHLRDCETSACEGCKPCPDRHCEGSGCPGRHLDDGERLTCPRCVGNVREDLALIGYMTGEPLDEEAMMQGVDSEAMMLNGPSADVEAWGHRALSAQFGRVDAAYLEDCRDELHPLWVLGTWEFAWRDHLGHEADKRKAVTVPAALAYLELQLTYMAQQDEPEFRQFAKEIRQCRSHLEDVLQSGERAERGAPCPNCRSEGVANPPGLVKDYDTADRTGAGDQWVCRKCKSWWSEADYRQRVGEDHIAHAIELTTSDMAKRTRVPAGTIRRWAAKTTERVGGETVDVGPLLKRSGKSHDGRNLYRVADVLALRDVTQSEVA